MNYKFYCVLTIFFKSTVFDKHNQNLLSISLKFSIKRKIIVLFAGETKSESEKTFVCSICDKRFFCKKKLRDHMNTHNKSHECEVCLKCFASKSSLTIHMRTHTGEKPYACSTCDKRFATKKTLQDHQTTHSDERKFKCDICPDDRYFKTKGQLWRHMLTHYEPKHSCTHCGKKFRTSASLTEHMKLHFKPTYPCAKCGAKFHTKSRLKQHEKSFKC